MRLRTLLAASFALLALGLTLVGSLAVQQIASTRLSARVGAEMAQLAGQVQNALEASLNERLSDMQILANLARTSDQSRESRREWLDTMRRIYPIYAWIGYASRDGVVEASTGGLLLGSSVGQRPWFKGGLSAPFFGDLHEALLLASALPPDPSGEPLRFVDVATPLQDATGSVVGVVGAHLGYRWIGETTRDAMATVRRKNPSAQVLILSGDGEVLLGPTDRAKAAVPTALIQSLKDGVLGDGHSSILEWTDGRSVQVGISRSAPRSDRPTLGWTVLMTQPAEIAYDATRQLSLQILGGGILLAILAALVGWWLAGLIARPLDRLSAAAIALGDEPSGLPEPEGFREVRHLTASMNALVQRLALRDAALAAVNRDLEARVAARTHDLEIERSRAEQAGRAKADFLANMSHELRTPLTGMLGVHDLLRDNPLATPEQRRLLDLAQEAGRSLLVIVNDVLDMSKLEAGQLAIEQLPVDLPTLVEGCREIAAESAGDKDVTVTTRIADDLPRLVIGDPTRIRQVVLNFATNAVKFTGRGEVLIAASRVGDRVRIEVRDTGIGIAAEALPHLFERFSQADTSTARRFGGTGLGLAICKRLVGMMDGTLGVESQVGAGSTFWFEFPLRVSGTEHVAGSAPRADNANSPTSRRLLLVEDNATNREILHAVLTRQGHAVTAAADGDEAVRAFRTERFDAILMDVHMPVKDGLMATAEIRAIEAAENLDATPIVALTANAIQADVDRYLAAGMDAHVTKPVDWAQLERTLDRLCVASVRDAEPHDDAPASVPIIDETILDTLAGYIGEERIGPLLKAFRTETVKRLGALDETTTRAADLRSTAHILVSMSGQLGFTEMSQFCAGLDAAANDERLDHEIQHLRDVAARALAAAATSRYAA